MPNTGWLVSSASSEWQIESSWFLLGKVTDECGYILLFPRPGSRLPGCRQTLHPHLPQNILKFSDGPLATKSAACPLVVNLNDGVLSMSGNWNPSLRDVT